MVGTKFARPIVHVEEKGWVAIVEQGYAKAKPKRYSIHYAYPSKSYESFEKSYESFEKSIEICGDGVVAKQLGIEASKIDELDSRSKGKSQFDDLIDRLNSGKARDAQRELEILLRKG